MLIVGIVSSYSEAKEMEDVARIFVVSRRIKEIALETKK